MVKKFFIILFLNFVLISCNSLEYNIGKKEPSNINNVTDSEAENLLFQADKLRQANACQEAIIIYEKSIEITKNNLSASNGKALCLMELAEFDKAAKIFENIISKDATKWQAINGLAIIYAVLGKKKESEEYFNMAMELNPDNPVILNNIGLISGIAGNKDLAVNSLTKAQNLPQNDKKRKKITNNLALIYGINGDLSSAEKILRNNGLAQAEIYNNLGFYAKLRDNKPLAKKYLTQALSTADNFYPKASNNLELIKNK